MDSVPAYVPVKQGVTEGESNDTAISLSKLGKFHPGADTLAEFVPERATAQYALHPDKWESTFYSLTNKDSDKLKYYGPKKISIPPGTLVGDMAIANKFYRAKTPEEQEQYALDVIEYETVVLPNTVRQQRNSLLASSDWTQAGDVPQAIKDVWAVYRQALRDVPQQAGFPTNITWPTKPA
jgi:hypothetical protein